MVGKELSPVLVQIEDVLWEFESETKGTPGFTDEGMRASIKIFMSAMMDKVWELQESEEMGMDERVKMVLKFGEELRELIKIYTSVDCRELYNK